MGKIEIDEQEKAQKSYERYRERFANDYGVTIEQATEYQAVKNYKEYLEEECMGKVKIVEKVGGADEGL